MLFMEWDIAYFDEDVQNALVEFPAGIQARYVHLTERMVAFANTAGGDLYIGIAESEFMGIKTRHWRGFKDQEAANGHVQSLEALFPLGTEYSYGFLRAPGSDGVVLHQFKQNRMLRS